MESTPFNQELKKTDNKVWMNENRWENLEVANHDEEN